MKAFSGIENLSTTSAPASLYPMDLLREANATRSKPRHSFSATSHRRVSGAAELGSDSDSSAGSFRSAESGGEEFDNDESDDDDAQIATGFQNMKLDKGKGRAVSDEPAESSVGPVSPEEDIPMDITDTEMEDNEDEDEALAANSSFASSSAGSAETRDSYAVPDVKTVPRIKLVPKWDSTPATPKITPTTSSVPKSVEAGKFCVIAHSQQHQAWFDKYSVPWSAQWQVAVMVSNGRLKWSDITEAQIMRMQGNNADVGPEVRNILLPSSKRPASGSQVPNGRSPWFELDKEEAALAQGTDETLGLLPGRVEAMGSWWGGRIEQRAIIYQDGEIKSICNGVPNKPKFAIKLVQQEVRGKSCRFARKFGSRRFIHAKLPNMTKFKFGERKALTEFLQKGHILNGRVWRAFLGKEGTAHMIETNEDVDRVANPVMLDHLRLSFPEFINWFNPLNASPGQITSKWSARFSLGQSTSIPGCIFAKSCIFFIPDIISPDHDSSKGKPDNNQVMTDGCGRINRAALQQIQRQRELTNIPTAVQGRIGGAKGLWLLDVMDLSEEPKIWITESQVKIKYSSDQLDDPSLRIFDLLRLGQVKTPIKLSNQPIVNFAHNGVPHETFSELLQEALEETMDQVLDEWNSDNTIKLWDMVFNKQGVAAMRKQRWTTTYLREFGHLSDKETDSTHAFLDDEAVLDSEAAANGPDPNSGWPSDMAEQVVELLQAGFVPRTCSLLATLVKSLLKAEVSRMTKPCRIPIKRSAEAFAVPDFSGLLKEGEVFIRVSQPSSCGLVDDPKMADGVVRGPMLIFRYPIRTPTDAQVVIGVDRPELYALTDVLVFATNGSRSGASILAGGDYDGDTIHMITDPRIVSQFTNADLKFADPPADFDSFVTQGTETCSELGNKLKSLSHNDQCKLLQTTLVSGCTKDSNVGLYSKWLDIVTYGNGYDHPLAHYLSYMFSNELDSEKSGRHVALDILDEDRKAYMKYRTPACLRKDPMEPALGEDYPRSRRLPKFGLDVLTPFARQQEIYYINLINQLEVDTYEDGDLAYPIREADRRAEKRRVAGDETMRDEIVRIKEFVKDNRTKWGKMFNEKQPSLQGSQGASTASARNALKRRGDSSEFFQLPKKVQIQHKREIARRFAEEFDRHGFEFFDADAVQRVLASFAYLHAYEKAGSLEYAFVVASNQLMQVKASKSTGGSVAVSRPFYDCLMPRRGLKDEIQAHQES